MKPRIVVKVPGSAGGDFTLRQIVARQPGFQLTWSQSNPPIGYRQPVRDSSSSDEIGPIEMMQRVSKIVHDEIMSPIRTREKGGVATWNQTIFRLAAGCAALRILIECRVERACDWR